MAVTVRRTTDDPSVCYQHRASLALGETCPDCAKGATEPGSRPYGTLADTLRALVADDLATMAAWRATKPSVMDGHSDGRSGTSCRHPVAEDDEPVQARYTFGGAVRFRIARAEGGAVR